jgi:putative SOS response-associated peptidase YedK
MCGRYTLQDPERLNALVASITEEAYAGLAARFNVAPSQENPVVATDPKGQRHATAMRWGLVPYWDRSETPKFAPINARSEEMFAKPTFKQSLQKRRCVVPADGYYEWKRRDERTKTPYLISLKDRQPFFFAGIYESATEVRPATYALLTCAPNPTLAEIHNRMPVILPAEAVGRWLEPGPLTEDGVRTLCVPYDAAGMQAWAVSSIVNNARNEVPECVVPVLS